MGNDYIRVPSKSSRRLGVNSFLSGFNTSLDESVLRFDVAKIIENFDFSSGVLKEGYGIKYSQLYFVNAVAAWEYLRWNYEKNLKESILMYLNSEGKVLYSTNGGQSFSVLENAVFTSTPYTVNYRLYGEDVILMCSETEGMLVWNGSGAAVKIDGAPNVTSLCMHYERMFVTVGGEKSSVYFSDDLDPTNWNENLNEGGFIQMLDERGTLNKVVSFANYVYIFRERGISRITAYADQNEFSATNLYVASGRIYPRTVVSCMDSVVFLADDGLYRFDGLSASRVLPQICGLVEPSPDSCGFFHGGRYYLSLRIKDSDGGTDTKNNALLVYELKSGSYQILTNVQINSFFEYGEQIFAITSDAKVGELAKCGEVFGTPTVKVWDSGLKDFGTERVKHIREFNVDATATLKLEVESERGKKSFDIAPKKGITTVRVNVSGRKIGLRLTTNESIIRIAAPSIKFTLA